MHPKKVRLIFIVILISLTLFSCKKAGNPADNNQEENIPVQRVYYTNFNNKISEEDNSIVTDLFNTNSLYFSYFQINYFRQNPDSLVKYYVNGSQYLGNLRIFNSDISLWFDSQRILRNRSGFLCTAFYNTKYAKVTKEQAGQFFYEKIASDNLFIDSLQSYKRKGFYAELGYYGLGKGSADSSKERLGIPCWRLTVINSSVYPNALIRADSLEFFYYENKVPIR